MKNPLDHPGTLFDFAGMNPNPTASKTKLGPVYRVSFEVEQDIWQLFMDGDTKGAIIAGRLFRSEDGEPETKENPEPEGSGEHGRYWYDLIRYGAFNAPAVLEAIGSDEDFKHWIQKQPSCLSKDSDWVEEVGEGRCEYAHVRRISQGAGEGIKPQYYGVPMTHDEHFLSHQSGETVTLNSHGPKKRGADPSSYNETEAAEWFEKQAQKHRLEWATTTLVESLGYGRRRDCPPDPVKAWVEHWDLGMYFPNK